MNSLRNRDEIEAFVKKWGWTFANVSLCLLVLWQGLTLFSQVQSWQALKSRSENLLMGVGSRKEKTDQPAPNPNSRVVEATFFFRPPKPTFKVSAVMDDYAIVNGEKVKAGGRVGNATVESIAPDLVILKIDGAKAPLYVDVNFGVRNAGGSDYQLTSILGEIAVINGKPVQAGDRIEKAVVQKVEGNSVTVLEDDAEAPKTLKLK